MGGVVLELGLKEAGETRIGNHAHRGCSGGEKRTSIWVQVGGVWEGFRTRKARARMCACAFGMLKLTWELQFLANPSVLFLNELTAGLDVMSAFQLVRTLKNLARKGRTIVTTNEQICRIWMSRLSRLIVLQHINLDQKSGVCLVTLCC